MSLVRSYWNGRNAVRGERAGEGEPVAMLLAAGIVGESEFGHDRA